MQHERARTDVEINAQEASRVLDQLKEKADNYRRAMTEANKANDLTGFNKAQKQLKQTERRMKQLQKSTFNVDNVMKNLSRTSQVDLTRAQRQIQNELKKTTRGTQEYVNKSRQLRLVSGELRKVRTEMQGVSGSQEGMLRRMANGFNRYSMMILGAVGALTGLGLAMRKLSQDAMALDAALAELSAITGLAGEELEWLGDKAKELSVSTTEDGVSITKSAEEITQAFKLMGSAQPELLKNKEALAEVTTEALKLAEAAKMDTETAVKSLANVMNQFGADASQATEYINTLAAGSKVGAAEVDDIAKSIVRFGAVAGTANISVEESVGLVETLAERGIKGEKAGTVLRNVLLKMQTAADHLNPEIVGLQGAFENLAKENMNASEMLQLFGQRGVTAGTILANNTERLEYFTEAVTDTNVAIEQANINTETQQAQLEQVRNRLKLAAMELGHRLTPALRHVTMTTGKLVRLINALLPYIDRYGKYVLVAASAFVAYTIAINAHIIAKKIFTAVTNIARGAMIAFNTAVKMNPIGLLVGAITGAAVALRLFKKDTDDMAESQRELNEVLKEGNEIFESFGDLQERMAVINTLNHRQLHNLKRSIQQQISSQQDYTTSLARELKKRLDNDLELLELKEKFRNQEDEILKAGIANRIKRRREDIARELEARHRRNNESLRELEAHLDKVTQTIAAHPDELAEIQDRFYEKEIEKLEQHLKERELALLKDHNKGKITKEQLDNELAALELSGLITRLALHEEFGRETIDLQIEIAKKQAKTAKDIQKQNSAEHFKEELADLEIFLKEKRLAYLQDHNNELLSAEQLKEKLHTLELTALEAKRDLHIQYGEDVIDIDIQIAEIKRQNIADELQAEKDAQNAKQLLRDEALAKRQQELEDYKTITDNLAQNVGAILGEVAQDSEMTSREVAKNLVLVFLDATHQVVRGAIAQIWAQSIASPESIATFGIAGVAKATALTALVEGAFAGIKSGISASMDKYPDQGEKKRVRGFASGRYEVTGAEDGKDYSAKYIGTPDTGFVWNPSLISEQGPEIIVDAKRSRNIRMRYPQLLDAIKQVPQYASGKIPSTSDSPGSGTDNEMKALLLQNTNVMAFLTDQLEKGIDSRISYKHAKEQFSKAERIEDASKRN